MVCNLMTAVGCQGATNFFGIWGGLALLFFLVVFSKKWLGEEGSVGFAFNWLGSLAAFPIYIVVAIIVPEFKWAMLGGLIGLFGGGFGTGGMAE